MRRRVLDRFYSWLCCAAWRLAEHRELRGIQVGVSPTVHAEQASFAKIDDALALIEAYDRRRFQRIRAHVRRVHAFGIQADYLGSWVDSVKTCLLAADWVGRADTRPVDIASAIVHEATHARLSRFGYDEPQRKRIEQMCHRQEEIFAARLPDAQDLVDEARRAQTRPSAFYSSTSLQEHRLRALRSVGAPAWIVRALGVLLRAVPPNMRLKLPGAPK